MSFWTELGTKVANLTESFILMKDKQSKQAEEITLLRHENAELRKDLSGVTERLARVEESRNTLAAQMESALTRTIAAWETQKLRAENDELKRKQLPPSDQQK